jgi:hypothetical protein
MTIIDLSRVEPRNYLSVIANTLDAIGYALKAEDIRNHPPKDLAEAFTRLPDDVCIRLWEVSHDTHNHA